MAGAFVASAVVFLTYHEAFDAFDGGMRQIAGAQGTAGHLRDLSAAVSLDRRRLCRSGRRHGAPDGDHPRRHRSAQQRAARLDDARARRRHRDRHRRGVRLQRRLRDQSRARPRPAAVHRRRGLGRRRLHRGGRLVVGAGRRAMRRRRPRRVRLRPARRRVIIHRRPRRHREPFRSRT